MPRIHILGASGSGTTTLGAALAVRLGIPQTDSDSVYWRPTDPPFTTARPRAERQAMLAAALPADGDWVLSGCATGWAGPIEERFTLIVLLGLDPALRMARLRAREAARHGPRIAPGGDMAEASAAFLRWAAAYDRAGPEQRSRAGHDAWLAGQPAPVLRLDSAAPVGALVGCVAATLR